MPGLVNAHAHSHSSLTRGSAEGIPLHELLRTIDRESIILTEDQSYEAALATYAEAMLSGTTMISDMCIHPHSAIRAAREIGIRLVVSAYTASTKPYAPDLSVTEKLLASHSHEDEQVKIWVGLHEVESCGDEQLVQGAHLAEKYNTGIHMHSSESQYFVDLTTKRTGIRPIAHLAKLGVLGEWTLMAHCVWVDEDDRRLIAEYQSHVAHCPQANLKLASGIAPIPEMYAKNISITLGTDGARANNRLDMFDTMKFASLIHRGTTLEPNILPPEAIINMASGAGYKAYGIQGGRLSQGMLADLIVVDLNKFHFQPVLPETIVTNLVHSAMGSDVDLVMVDGKIVVNNGEIVFHDQNRIIKELSRIGKELINARSM